jgi:hypothetical protein
VKPRSGVFAAPVQLMQSKQSVTGQASRKCGCQQGWQEHACVLVEQVSTAVCRNDAGACCLCRSCGMPLVRGSHVLTRV